jgi:integrase
LSVAVRARILDRYRDIRQGDPLPRPVKDSKLDSRAARAKLAPRGKPYYRAIDHELHLGYRKSRSYGRWVARIYVGNQQYRVETIGTADDHGEADGLAVLDWRQAQAKARERQAAIAREIAGVEEPKPKTPLTVADVVNAYLEWTGKHRRSSTAREWRYMAKAHILSTLGKLEVAKLTTARLRKWHEDLAELPGRLRTRPGATQRYREQNGDSDAARARRATANRNLTVLKAALNHAWQGGRITSSDEAWRRVKPFRGADAARVRYLQIDECTRLLNACPEDFRKLVRGALVSGARYGELCRADVRDFNSDSASLLVRESKGGKPRHILLDDEAAAFFVSITAGRRPTDPLFVRADGKRWGKSHQRRPLVEACKAARIEPAIGFHILRHTWASLRIMAGLPLIVAAEVLGHSDTRMCERHYGHLAQSFIREAVRGTALHLGPIESNVAPLRPGSA